MKKYTKLNIRNAKYPLARKVAAVKMKLKKGDSVIVVSGKDKGKKGEIVRAFPALGKVLIDGVGIAKRHKGGKRAGQSGHVVEIARPVDASNVMLLDPKGGKPTRVGRSKDGNRLVRVAKKSGATLA